tara:strand:+ start:102 stop:779 length:678 start_codon:yes stop_codon:yes gene_type:complete
MAIRNDISVSTTNNDATLNVDQGDSISILVDNDRIESSISNAKVNESTEEIKDSVQGYVGVITDYYKFDDSNITQQLNAGEWTKLQSSENVIFDYKMDGQEGLELWNSTTDTYSLAGLDEGSFASIRILCRVSPEVDESAALIRLNFQTNAATQSVLPSFQVESQLFNMTQGADIWYSDEENISFFVADSLSGNTIAEAGSVTMEIKSSVDAQVEVLAYTLYMNK